mmetsp:Transcript_46169/g.150122  ORF Transcript_46169/g.150122 Transcript_46169/m.150122 type:complete len:169 (+) Transcript_46169:59-565(+)
MPARAEPLLPVARHEDRQQRATRAVADVTVEPLVAAADGSSSPAAVGSSSHAEAEPSKTFPPLFERPPLCLVAFALLLSTAVALLCTVFRDALAVVLRQPSGEAAALLLREPEQYKAKIREYVAKYGQAAATAGSDDSDSEGGGESGEESSNGASTSGSASSSGAAAS